MILQHQFSVAANHPSLQDHFPGNPIVPGVVILNEVLHIVREMTDFVSWSGAPNVKFHSPLRPEEMVELSLEFSDSGEIIFRGQVKEHLIISGMLIFKPKQVFANGST